jgi:phage baseplate assembly protein W
VPLQEVSRGFKDISLSFKRHPITSDLLPLKNEDAIKKAVQNLVRTQIGEVFFDELLGTNVTGSLFELATRDLIDEPRVDLTSVRVTSKPDDNLLNIEIRYDIVGLSLSTQTVSFVLEPTRL